jgi:hypothetical protein
MSRREKPSLGELQRDLLHQTRELHREFIAPEEHRGAAASAPVSRELMRIADSTERNGLDVQMADLESGGRPRSGPRFSEGQGRMRRGAIQAK